jgi:hypothetical protein
MSQFVHDGKVHAFVESGLLSRARLERQREILGRGLCEFAASYPGLKGGGEKLYGISNTGSEGGFFGQVFFLVSFFFSLYIANRILHIYLDPRGTSFACLLAWMGLGIKLVPRGSKCEHDDRAQL